MGKLPPGHALPEAVTLPNNVVTVFNAVTKDLELPLPWPVPSEPPAQADAPILIWGASSSVGQYALQILAHWGYRNVYATASPKHWDFLRQQGGAKHFFDYRDPDVARKILEAARALGGSGPAVPYIVDCIGSQNASLASIASIAEKGSKVAIMLPVIVRDATDDTEAVYAMEVEQAAPWTASVDARGVRTHFYLTVSPSSASLHRSRLLEASVA